MKSKKLNWTNRKKINKGEVSFSIDTESNKIPSFNANFAFAADAYPPEAKVKVKAYYKETSQTFNWGEVSNLVPPSNRSLDEIGSIESLKFQVLVIDPKSKGLLLGLGDNFVPSESNQEAVNKSSIISLKAGTNLGQLAWKLEIDADNLPKLLINKNIPEASHKLKYDPLFRALIYPAVMREILTFYIWDEIQDGEYAEKWIQFAGNFTESDVNDCQDSYEKLDWIEEVVSEFSERKKYTNGLIAELLS
ncbi:hypothetical protein N8574_01865 [Akkermansiaceae bacterium]|nr:hypothetical protein [Akkermansiaceae bacterium]